VSKQSGGFERDNKVVRGVKLAGIAKRVGFTQHGFVINLDCGMSGQIHSGIARQWGVAQW
jgi:hypothetical protein